MSKGDLTPKSKFLYAFTSTESEPFQRLYEDGLKKTWLANIESPSIYIRLLGGGQDNFRKLTGALNFYERLRWKSIGRFSQGVGRIAFKPFSYFKPKVELIGHDFKVLIPECLSTLGFKHLAAMEYALKNDFDFLIMTNSSSYLHVNILEEYLSALDSNHDFYGGKTLNIQNQIGASGSFYVLSRVTMQKIIVNRSSWIHALLDDIALMKMCSKLGISFSAISSIDLKDVISIESINRESLNSYFHIKCGPALKCDYRIDDELMEKIHHKLN
jgi:hypothetical protein